MPPNEADFEKEFEQALASYADPGDAGLSSRVLAAIEARQGRRRWLLRWSLAAPALACLAVAFLLWPTKRPHEIVPASRTAEVSKSHSIVLPEQPRVAVANEKAQAEDTTENHAFRRVEERGFSHASVPRKFKGYSPGFLMTTTRCTHLERPCSKTSGRLPKLDQFPTPRPLSKQEKLLIAFATQIPESEQKAILEKQQQADGPLHIVALSIQPLDINKQP